MALTLLGEEPEGSEVSVGVTCVRAVFLLHLHPVLLIQQLAPVFAAVVRLTSHSQEGGAVGLTVSLVSSTHAAASTHGVQHGSALVQPAEAVWRTGSQLSGSPHRTLQSEDVLLLWMWMLGD